MAKICQLGTCAGAGNSGSGVEDAEEEVVVVVVVAVVVVVVVVGRDVE